ncbi:endonuclease/exonuclease/phosphatase family protein [Paenibacillus senegalensis]|uniref:endonuclease/exonuclease/phosphatase family protein n=1 Tax=Paenibacillus senegalensis TaxID=1465766 RepID=UPI0002881F70|nr:endonuclease/exonuclease/phosphatase family protein [Paenibacillus senegalensis]
MLTLSGRQKLSWFTVCLMILHCFLLAVPASADASTEDSIKVLTYNINVGVSADTRVLDLERIANTIRDSGADVIGLQRVDKHYGARSEWKDQAKEIADLLGMYYVYGANIDNNPAQEGEPRRQYGNAILSKYPIVSSENHLLTRGREQRGMLAAEIDWNGKTLWFNSTHLAGISAETLVQIPEIVAATSQQTGYKVFSGSLNHLPGAAELEPLNDTFYDVRTGRLGGETTPSTDPRSRTDYVYADYQLEVVHSEVIHSLASTARPFLAELKVADPSKTIRSLSFEKLVDFAVISEPTSFILYANHADRTATPLTSGAAYSSSDPDIATVDSNGMVTGLATGTTVITASYLNFIAEMQVNVVERIPGTSAALSEIRVDGTALESFDPEQTDYTVTLPTFAAIPAITATPEDAYAQVDVAQAAGLPGTSIITVTSEDGLTVKRYTVKLALTVPQDPGSKTFKAMAFNIHHGVNNANVLDLEGIAQVIAEHDIDIVGLQEVDKHYSSRSDLKDQAKELADMLDMYYVFGANLDRDPVEGPERRQYGTAILSKYPIVSWENYHLESFGQEQRGLLEAQIDIDGDILHFYSTHLGLSTEQRISQANEIKEILQNRTRPKIVTGDFNAQAGTPEMDVLLGDGTLIDSFRYMPDALTFPSSGATSRIDFILYSDEVKMYDGTVVQTEASDHFPLYGVYSITATPQPAAMMQLLEQLADEGEFANRGAARSLIAQLNTVIRFYDRGELDLAERHLSHNFLSLLETHRQGERVSARAYEALTRYAEALLNEWQSV